MEAIQQALISGLRPLRKAPALRLSEWAARNFYLSAESSYDEQPWHAYPYQVAPLDCIGNDAIEEVVWSKSSRVGYTKAILAAIAYFAEHKHRNQGVWQPTDEDSDEFVKTELEPMIRDVPAMVEVFPGFLHHHKNNTLRSKIFLGSMLHMRGGKAAKNYRRLSISTAFIDELDAFDIDIEGEGSPVELARKRIEGATFPKLVVGSTPKTKGLSMIESRLRQAAKCFAFNINCPHCDAEQTLRFGGRNERYGFKWVDHDPETVAHLCEACGTLYGQAEYLSVWERGRWLAADGTWIDDGVGCFRDADNELIPAPRSVGFHIWTAYSPQTDWSQIVRQFLSATKRMKAGDKAELKTFRNTTLGESWEEDIDKVDQHELARRAETYRIRTVPVGGLVLVAGVDVQDNRFEVVVWAIGRGEEMWAVDYMVIDANPADERDWIRLDDYLLSRFAHADGGTLGIEGAAVDTGGHFTHQAYNFCRGKTKHRIFAIKGDAKPGQDVKSRSSLQDVNWRGKIIKSGVRLWLVGTDTAKNLFFGRLKVSTPGPGYVHFPDGLPDEFYEQITSEARQLQKTARGEVHRWVRLRARNEVLDATVYALFVSHALGLHTSTERMWSRLAARVAALRMAAEVKQEVEAPEPPQRLPIASPRRRGFVKGWRDGR